MTKRFLSTIRQKNIDKNHKYRTNMKFFDFFDRFQKNRNVSFKNDRNNKNDRNQIKNNSSTQFDKF